MTAVTLLDPTSERLPAQRERTPRPATLDGLTIGLLDIAKARGDVFLDRIAEHLTERGLQVEHFRKPTFTKVLPPALTREIVERADVVIEALAD
jgi:hypothetical protein